MCKSTKSSNRMYLSRAANPTLKEVEGNNTIVNSEKKTNCFSYSMRMIRIGDWKCRYDLVNACRTQEPMRLRLTKFSQRMTESTLIFVISLNRWRRHLSIIQSCVVEVNPRLKNYSVRRAWFSLSFIFTHQV